MAYGLSGSKGLTAGGVSGILHGSFLMHVLVFVGIGRRRVQVVGGGGQNPPSSNGNSSLVGLLHSNNQNQSTADQAQPSPYQAPAKSPAGSQLNGNIMSPTPSQVIFNRK